MELLLVFLTNAVLLLGVLFVLVLVHEWGHFIVAKRTGMRVDEFGIGFPPRLFSWRKEGGETLYSLNALPIGGFVRIWGENYEEKVGGESEADTAPDPQEPPHDLARAFSARPKWAQALVLIAGVTMNVILAWALFSLTFMVGVPTAVDVETAGSGAELMIGGVLPDAPAAAIPPGAVVRSVTAGDTTLGELTPSALTSFITETAPAPLTVSYEFQDETQSVTISPQTGLIEAEPERYAIGVSLALVETKSYGFFEALWRGVQATGNGLVAVTVGLKELVLGQADLSQVAGPVGIGQIVGQAAQSGIVMLLSFTAFISLNLAVINLLPFPALDGGRLVFVAIETVTGRPIPPAWAGRMNLIGFALLITLMLFVTYNDIARIF